jgi:hypothetical protein
MASRCRSCHYLIPNSSPVWPSSAKLAALQPHLVAMTDLLAEYTATAIHAPGCPAIGTWKEMDDLEEESGACTCIPEGALFDAVDEHEVISAFLRWLHIHADLASETSAHVGYTIPAGRPGLVKTSVA